MARAFVVFAYRNVSTPTTSGLLQLASAREPWRVMIQPGDALISRARSTAASQWLTTHPEDDVLVMCDDDFSFTPEGLDPLVSLARQERAIVAGVTPLRTGEFAAIVPLDGAKEMWLRPTDPPTKIRWAGGLIAYHRSVFDRLAKTLPLLHAHDAGIPAFWPFFMPMILPNHRGQDVYLSEDYACHERAQRLGIDVWVHPACQVGHLAEVMVTTETMAARRAFYESVGAV